MPFGAIASVFNALFGNVAQNKRQQEALKAQQKENEKDRKFNAEQAELNRTWQEKMYNSYESPIAQAQQRQQAGLNPAEGVSSQSVGSGSTASSGSSSLPTPSTPVTLDSGAFNGLLNVVEQFKQQRIATKQAEENLKATTLENQKRAIDAGNYAEVVQLQMDLMRQDKRYKYWSAEKLKAEAEKQIEDTGMFKDYRDQGGNTYIEQYEQASASIQKIFSDIADGHALTEAQIAKINDDMETNRLHRSLLRHTLELSKKFDEKFLNLDLQQREQAVKEYMDNAEFRANFNNWSNDIAQWAHRNAEQQSIINDLVNQYQRDIWLEITENLEGNKLDAVLMKWLIESPRDLFDVLSHFKPDITIDQSTRYTTIANSK